MPSACRWPQDLQNIQESTILYIVYVQSVKYIDISHILHIKITYFSHTDFTQIVYNLRTDYIQVTYSTYFTYSTYIFQLAEYHKWLQSNYWLVSHFRAQVLMYHHLQPSALSFFVSQVAPGKVLFPSLHMEYWIVPVSPTGTTGILPRTDVIGMT